MNFLEELALLNSAPGKVFLPLWCVAFLGVGCVMISYDFILQFVSPPEILESRIPNAVGFWKAHE